MEVFRAGIGGVDASRFGGGVPAVDSGVELQTRIGALPRRLGDLTQQVGRVDGRGHLAGGARRQRPLAALQRGLHELVAHPHRVVGVLVEQRGAVDPVEAQIESGFAQHLRLALLAGFAPHELGYVRVVGVEDHHFGGPSGGAARADGPGGGVGAAHEADRPAGASAAGEVLRGRAEPAQVHARPRAALEDQPLLGVPVEDRLHGVLHRQDEAGRGLRQGTRNADVEPHRRVERGLLRNEQVGQLVLEGCQLGGVGEVAVLGAPAADSAGDSVDELPQGPLAVLAAGPAAEVLLGDDVDGVLRPGRRELHVGLLEDDTAGRSGDESAAATPLQCVVGMVTLDGEPALDADTGALRQDGHLLTLPSGTSAGRAQEASARPPSGRGLRGRTSEDQRRGSRVRGRTSDRR